MEDNSGFFGDTTDCRRAEELLRESEEKFERIAATAKDAIILIDNDGKIEYCNEAMRTLESAVEQTADMVIVTNRDGVIEYVNPAFEKITGYDKNNIIGKKPGILKSGRQDKKFYEKLWGTILAGEAFRAVLKRLSMRAGQKAIS
ncbi:MAG: PAS domain S-box protein [Euryarchaeota archaeon]|nr:PAS domain S-box protein [Euryarchaeota archaeon]